MKVIFMKQVALIGLGRFGLSVLNEFKNLGVNVYAFDKNYLVINSISNEVLNALVLDSTDEEALIKAKIRQFDTVIIAIGKNTTDSILTTTILKELGIKNIIARATSIYHKTILEKIGADKVVFPEDDIGIRIARTTAISNLLDYIDFPDENMLFEISAPSKIVDKTYEEIELLSKKFEVNLLAIKRQDKVIQISKNAEKILKDDILIFFGKDKTIKQIRKFFGE